MSTSAGDLWLFAGLGNPGREHRRNRHNVGFMFVDRIGESMQLEFTRKLLMAVIAKGSLEGEQVILAKPQTFMNESGRAVASLTRHYHLAPERLVVIYDDLDLPLGSVRLRPEGGSAGHNGMRSIIQQLGSRSFPRMRIGIGRPPGRMDPAEYVLRDFQPDEIELIDIALRHAETCLRTMLREGVELAMTYCNSFLA
jgi:PTH1 family peptidyl-tRNA hydrolase